MTAISLYPPHSSASTSINVDGQAHDPGYMDALRDQLAMIGENSSLMKGNPSRSQRRRSALGLSAHPDYTPPELFLDSDEDDEDDGNRSYGSSMLQDGTRSRGHSTSTSHRSKYDNPISSLSSSPPPFISQPSSPRQRKLSIGARSGFPDSRDVQTTRSARRGSSPLGLQDDWGFTGIVDMERQRQQRRMSGEQDQDNLSATTSSSISQAPPQRPRGLTPLSMQPVETQQGAKARAASFHHGGSRQSNQTRPLLKKSSAGDVRSDTSPLSKAQSFRQKFISPHGTPRSRSRPSSSGSNSATDGKRSAGDPAPGFFPHDGERMGLSTIQSGKTFEDHLLNVRHESPALDSSSTMPLSSSTSISSESGRQLPARTSESILAGDSLDSPHSQVEYFGGSSSGKDSTEWEHASEGASVHQPYELRRRMELFAMGVRFNAFKAKRKIKRSLTANEM